MSQSKPVVGLAAIALFMLAPSGLAQEDGCTQPQPCPLAIDLDADGMSVASDPDPAWTVTVGDWYQIDFLNIDEEAHTVTLSEHGLSWTVPAVDGLTTEPFPFDTAGSFQFQDGPSGDTAPIDVVANDAVAVEEGEEDAVTDLTQPGDGPGDEHDAQEESPGLALAALAVSLVALAAARRH